MESCSERSAEVRRAWFRRTRASNSELESEPLPASMLMVVLDISGSHTITVAKRRYDFNVSLIC
jgi:hypothetical protein